MKLERSQTLVETERRCLESARINAMQKISIMVSSRTNATTTEHNGTVSTTFNSSDATQVMGKWLYDITEPQIEWKCVGTSGDFLVTTRVHGLVKPFAKGETEILLRVLKRENKKSREKESDIFFEGELISFEVTAAEDGLIYLFYLDHYKDTAYMLLPQDQAASDNLVYGNKPLEIMKNELHATVSDTLNGISHDELLLIYAPTKVSKPLMKEVKGLKALNLTDLNKWMAVNIGIREDVTIERRQITISKVKL